jgi:hypothetical protein
MENQETDVGAEAIKILTEHMETSPKCVIAASITGDGRVKLGISSKGAVSDLNLLGTLIKKRVEFIVMEAFKANSEGQ